MKNLVSLFLNKLDRFQKQLIVIVFDIISCIITIELAYSLRLENFFIPTYGDIKIFLLAIFIFLPIFFHYGFYREIFRYSNLAIFANIFKGWHLMEDLWPVFPLGVGIGLFQLYLFGGRDKGVLTSASILGGFSIIALSFTLFSIDFDLLFPIALILLGVRILFKK